MRYAPLLLVVALGACSQQPGANGNAAGASGTAAAPAAPAIIAMQPGKWESTVTITDLQISGLPPGTKQPKPPPKTSTSCMTPEQAAKGPSRVTEKLTESFGGKCDIAKSEIGGGRIAVALTCQSPGGPLSLTVNGTYSPTSVTTDAEARLTGKMAMTEKVHSEAHRVGVCD